MILGMKSVLSNPFSFIQYAHMPKLPWICEREDSFTNWDEFRLLPHVTASSSGIFPGIFNQFSQFSISCSGYYDVIAEDNTRNTRNTRITSLKLVICIENSFISHFELFTASRRAIEADYSFWFPVNIGKFTCFTLEKKLCTSIDIWMQFPGERHVLHHMNRDILFIMRF